MRTIFDMKTRSGETTRKT